MFGARGGVAGRYSCSPDQGRTVATINVHVLRGDIVHYIYITHYIYIKHDTCHNRRRITHYPC